MLKNLRATVSSPKQLAKALQYASPATFDAA